MDIKKFRILFTNLQKLSVKILFKRQSEVKNKFQKNEASLRREKSIFSDHPQSSEWIRKEESHLQSHNGKTVLGLSCHICICIETSLLT